MKTLNDQEFSKFIITEDGKILVGTTLFAEDVNSPGNYYAVQGQFNSSGYFELLTAGSGTTTTDTTSTFLLESGSNFLLESGDELLLEA